MNDERTVGQSDGEFDKTIRIVSKDKVALRAFVKQTERIIGGIFLLEKYDVNTRMNKYEITDIGSNAAEETGLKVGDIVVADALARYYDTFPVSIIKYDSIILKIDKDESDEFDATKIYPLKNTVIVTLDKLEESNKNGIVILTDLLPIGTVTHINQSNSKISDIKVGNKILITDKCDVVVYRGKKLYIFKYIDIPCIIE